MSYPSALPEHTLTDKRLGFGRLRVDVAQTSFFIGTQARTFKEFSIASGGTYAMRLVFPVNTVLLGLNLNVDSGSIKMEVYRGSTPSGSFSETLPVFSKNEMSTVPSPAYAPVTTVSAGGTISGGTLRDVARVATSGATAQAATVGGEVADERGILAGTTEYIRLTNFGNGTATGVFYIFWEERP